MTTLYDIYASMRHIGAAGGTVATPLKEMKLPYIPAKARSIFEVIEAKRTCESVGTVNSCICHRR